MPFKYDKILGEIRELDVSQSGSVNKQLIPSYDLVQGDNIILHNLGSEVIDVKVYDLDNNAPADIYFQRVPGSENSAVLIQTNVQIQNAEITLIA